MLAGGAPHWREAKAIDRILGKESELRELWEESEERAAWNEFVEDLRARLGK